MDMREECQDCGSLARVHEFDNRGRALCQECYEHYCKHIVAESWGD